MKDKTESQWKKASPERVDFFYRILENHPEVEKRKMFGYPCAFIGGNMFFGLFEDSVFLRLSSEDRTEIQQQEKAAPFEPLPGRVMKEYVVLKPPILQDKGVFLSWFEKSREYASGLPSKEKKGAKK